MGDPEELERELEQRKWGRRVVVHHKPKYDKEYVPEAWAGRKSHDGQKGVIVDLATGHGTCFRVWFRDGQAYYEPDELEQCSTPSS
jgi:hypothetical protein